MGKCPCPGDLRTPVIVNQANVLQDDSAGGQTVDFQPWFNAWAKVKLGARREQFREDQIKGIKFLTLAMYYDARVTDKLTMTILGLLYNIRSADPIDGVTEWMEVIVSHGEGA